MAGSPIDPSFQFALVTPSDTVVLKYDRKTARCKGIAFGGAGDLAIKDDVGNTVVIPGGALATGIIHPVSTDLILSTGTTATEIVAFF